ncbi:MAG: site-specific DNA-methyltransferase, partial [Clostridia bacterium]|nr:site-specific DNA-methyltransferase [Clostridia bacterium]
FPNVITETRDRNGKLKKAINFELLKQMLSHDIVEGDEVYEFTWVGKKEAIVEAGKPIRKTLRPCKEESKDWETTENLYVEGDNLDVLKLLKESYLGKIKMIYIDPPYNTGKDSFVYPDKFLMEHDEYAEQIGLYDEDQNKLFKENNVSNPRFHSDWCSMLYPRLQLASYLLSPGGLIFISINDIEAANLRKMCDEIFGASNFVADLIWANKEGGGSSDSSLFRIKHEHILCYAKQIEEVEILGVPISNEERYKFRDEYVATRGKYYLQKLGMGSIQYSASLDYPIEAPDGTVIFPADNNNGRKACWRWSREKFAWGKENGFVEIKKDSKGIWTVYTKQYLNCDNEGNIIVRTQRPMGIIDEYSSTQAAKLLESMGMGNLFDYSKPVELIQYLLRRTNLNGEYVLDFFSGSATTAHAVMKLNAEDGGKRKFIMVQLPEPCAEESEAYKAGYQNICEIGKERIRRAGEKIREEGPVAEELDVGFRVFKLDSSNMKDVYYSPAEYRQTILDELISNIKEDRTDLDLLFGCLLEWGLPLSLPHTSEEISGMTVHTYNDGDLVACFADSVPEEVIREIARRRPLRAVFRDSSFASSPAKINVTEIFKLIAPNTSVKVL